MRLVEVVRGAATAPDVLATGVALGRRIGKLPVAVGVCYGFVGNRMLARRGASSRAPAAREAPCRTRSTRRSSDFGFPMGPFAMADLAGLDIGWRAPQGRTRRAMRAGGRRALRAWAASARRPARGFYRYAEGARAAERDPEVEALIEAESAEPAASRGATSRRRRSSRA